MLQVYEPVKDKLNVNVMRLYIYIYIYIYIYEIYFVYFKNLSCKIHIFW